MIGILAVVALAIGFILLYQRGVGVLNRRNLLNAFAKVNNYTYAAEGDIGVMDGLIFQFPAKTKEVSDVVSGRYKEVDLKVFDYMYATGGGGPRGGVPFVYTYTIIQLQLKKNMPHILFTERHGPELSWHKLTTIDKNEIYNLSAEDGGIDTARKIFDSQFITYLASKPKLYSLEVINDHAFIYTQAVNTSDQLNELYSIAQNIIPKLP